MNAMEYPIEAEKIIRAKRSLLKQLRAKEGLPEKRIALLSGTTIGDIKSYLEIFLLDAGIRPVFFEGDYGRYYEEIVFDDGKLRAFAPDVIFINTSIHNVELPHAADDEETADRMLDDAFEKLNELWSAASEYKCAVIQNNFEYPRVRVMGNYDGTTPSGRVRFIRRLNERMADYAFHSDMLHVNDVNYLSALLGVSYYSDPSYYNSYKYAVNPTAIPHLCHSVASIIKSLFGLNKKALVLDLDDTLWGGVVGEVGGEGIALGTDTPVGMAFLEMQRYVKELKEIGVVLGVCSKNEEENALLGFSNSASVLKREDFAAFKANWEPKIQNLEDIAKQLNLGIDSFVFVDDNPAEREIVSQAGAGIAIPSLDAPERYTDAISAGAYFEVTALSQDDRNRAAMYAQNAQREMRSTGFSDYPAYLRSLEMEARIGAFTEERLDRLTQLVNKTNQFNLTTQRYSLSAMRAFMTSESHITLFGQLRDKFGDNGVVTEIIAEKGGDRLTILLWVMSCRVFKRGLEGAMFDALVYAAKNSGIKTIIGKYIATEKNRIVADYYETLGFRYGCGDENASEWIYEIPVGYEKMNEMIAVEYEGF
jgi:FkbH-like protein